MTTQRFGLDRVVAIANGKGGVGKTSLTTTLAGIAGEAGYRVLVVDLDPQGNVGEDFGYTGAELGDSGTGLVAAILTGEPLPVAVPATRPNVDVVTGGDALDDLAGLLLSRSRRGVEVADGLVAPLSGLLVDGDYDLVLIDCPPGEPTLQILALGAARWLIVPTKSDAASMKGMVRIAARLAAAREHNPAVDLLGVVLFDVPTAATRMRREISLEIQTALGGVAPLFETAIRHSVAAVAARGRGLLVHEYASELSGEPFWKALKEGRSPATPGTAPALATDYSHLTHEILTRIAALEDAATDTDANTEADTA